MNQHSERKNIIGISITIAFIIVLIKIFYIQIIDSSFKKKADENFIRIKTIYPARGLMYDRNGKLMVFNKPIYDIMIIPRQAKNNDTAKLCRLFDLNNSEYNEILKKAIIYSRDLPSPFYKQMGAEQFAKIQDKLFQFEGIFPVVRTIRSYEKPMGAHIFGYLSETIENDIKKDSTYQLGDYIGRSGIEKFYEKMLRGIKGVEYITVDNRNREQGRLQNGELDIMGIQGDRLQTSIDADLQYYAEQLLQNKVGSLVAIEPKTGEILALVSQPNFDPSLLSIGRQRNKLYNELLTDSTKPLINRALTAAYPPGSTFKAVQALVGLQEGVISSDFGYHCGGAYYIGRLRVRCAHGHPSCTNLASGIAESCNPYFCEIFRRIIEQPKFDSIQKALRSWDNYMYKFGLGKKLGIDLDYEVKGNIPTDKYYDKIYNKKWHASTIISLGIGQGEILVSPLQMANMTCVIANRGYFIKPHAVRGKMINGKLKPLLFDRISNNIKREYYDVVIEGLADVITDGTARVAAIEGIEVCGKTGTAQNPHGNNHSLFVSFAPRNNPKIVVACIIENAGYGGTYAAPISSLVMEKYLNDTIAASRKNLEEKMLKANTLGIMRKKPH
jgi:penicillin-binding protein 2